MKELLRIYQASVFSEGQTPLVDCSLDIQAGEVFFLMGGNNSGRVLLTEFLSGRKRMTRGQLYLWDQRLRDQKLPSEQMIWADRSRKMTQNLSIEANLRCLGGRGRESRGKALQELLHKMAFPCGARDKLSLCPEAAQIQLWFILAILRNCPLVCLELTGLAFSETEREALMQTVRTCREYGISTILSAEKENGLISCADRIAWMEGGRIVKIFYSGEEWRKAVQNNRFPAGEPEQGELPGRILSQDDQREKRKKRVLRIPADSYLHLQESRSIGRNLILGLPRRTGTRLGIVRRDMESFLEAEFRRKYQIGQQAELVQDLTTAEKKLLILYRTMLMRPGQVILEEPYLFLEEFQKEEAAALIREMEKQGCKVRAFIS